mgnify:FL=1
MTESEVVSFAIKPQLQQLWVAYAPVGPVQNRLRELGVALESTGIALIPFVRRYDRLIWPHCGKGFFQLRKHIPELLDALVADELTEDQTSISEDGGCD